MEKAMRATLEWQARLRDKVKRLREMELDTLEGEVGWPKPKGLTRGVGKSLEWRDPVAP